ncbi:MAG: (2Fe-2S)-binding protein [Phycisphaerae bacterium]|nr:(2Fe-2S)-binding protein [Phycisphaerae bacterium]
MRVDRCICHHHTFAQLREIASRQKADFAALRERTGCCTGCGMCLPYVLRMLESGETSFPLFSECTAQEIIARNRAKAITPDDSIGSR